MGKAVSPKGGKEGTSAEDGGCGILAFRRRMPGGRCGGRFGRSLRPREVGVLRCAWRLMGDLWAGDGQEPPLPQHGYGKGKCEEKPEEDLDVAGARELLEVGSGEAVWLRVG